MKKAFMSLQFRLFMAGWVLRAITVVLSYDLRTGVAIWSNATHVVHLINLIQIAALVTTAVIFPSETLGILGKYRSVIEKVQVWLLELKSQILELKPPQIGVQDFIREVKGLLGRIAENGPKTEYIAMQFNELADVATTIYTGNGHTSPLEELKTRFYWDNIERIRSQRSKTKWEDIVLDGRVQQVPVIVAQTVG